MKIQRLRLTFARGEEAKGLTHREMMQALEKAIGAAGLPLAYSEGRRSTPQISIAAPLPVDVTSDCELADVFLSDRVEPGRLVESLNSTLPAGLRAVRAEEVGIDGPALQTRVRWAEYEADVPRANRSATDVRSAMSDLLTARSFPWEHRRETKVRRYDLRPLVLDARLEAEGEGVFRLVMRLRIYQERSGRADQVVAALGLDPPLRVHRRRLYVERTAAAVSAYRRRVERED